MLTGLCVGVGTVFFLFPAVSEGWTAVGGADDPGWRSGNNGRHRHLLLQKAGIVATASGNRPGDRWTIPAAELIGQQHSDDHWPLAAQRFRLDHSHKSTKCHRYEKTVILTCRNITI